MANTGHAWGSWAFVQKSSADWSADALADSATETSDAITPGTKSAVEIGVSLYEDNTGAISGDVTVYVLGTMDDTNYEEPDHEPSIAFNVTPIQNDTVYFRFNVDPAAFGKFKIAIKNSSGQELAVTVKIRTADIPAAS